MIHSLVFKSNGPLRTLFRVHFPSSIFPIPFTKTDPSDKKKPSILSALDLVVLSFSQEQISELKKTNQSIFGEPFCPLGQVSLKDYSLRTSLMSFEQVSHLFSCLNMVFLVDGYGE
jgi:hypothetical protein